MKSGIHAGAIAGVIIGIIQAICSFILTSIGIIKPPGGPEVWDFSLNVLFLLAVISLGVIWGIIFGAIYKFLYGFIPGKGVVKGLCYGLLIWLVKDIAAGSYVALIGFEMNLAIGLIIVGFFMWIAYGLVIGVLYKPTK
ncbi:MAG: hypothetical protein NWF08_01845 [Candidatus Bathyarchaeota archaeon]|nr:hypothetical protein [Candidatus Bathyarchaeota archaeon]